MGLERKAMLRAAPAHTVQYERRRPEQTLLHRLVRVHLETFLAQVQARTGTGLPEFVRDAFEAFLECGILAHGFLRVRCADCALLLDELLSYVTESDVDYRHQWQYGDVVIWDNRCVLHRATGDYPVHERRYCFFGHGSRVVRRSAVANLIGMIRLPVSGAMLSSERLQCLRLVLTTDSTFSLGKSFINVMVTSRVLLAPAL
jgi:hypothetical protein